MLMKNGYLQYLVKVGVFKIGKLYWVYIGRGLNNVIFRGIFQYVAKLRVLFNMPRTHMICHRFTE